MSQQNIELVERAVRAFNRHDAEALAKVSDEDFAFVSMLSAVDSGATYHGPDAWSDYFEAMNQTWEEWTVAEIQVFDAPDDLLAARFRIVGTGRQSGIRVEREVGMSYEFRQGKFWRMRAYLDPSEALEAVGLAE